MGEGWLLHTFSSSWNQTCLRLISPTCTARTAEPGQGGMGVVGRLQQQEEADMASGSGMWHGVESGCLSPM